MYSQQEALGQLLDYSALDSDQQKAQEFIVEFVRANPDYWSRANLAGHLTGSATPNQSPHSIQSPTPFHTRTRPDVMARHLTTVFLWACLISQV